MKSEGGLQQQVLFQAQQLLSRLDSLISAATKAGVAYFGYKAANHWSGAVAGLVGLRLAESPSLTSSVAGLGVLTLIGATNIVSHVPTSTTYTPPPPPPNGTSTETYDINTDIASCYKMGGTVVTVVPGTNYCVCRLPKKKPTIPTPPSGLGGVGGPGGEGGALSGGWNPGAGGGWVGRNDAP